MFQTTYANPGARSRRRSRRGRRTSYAIAAADGRPSPRSGPTRAAPTRSGRTGCCPLPTGFRQENFQGMNATDYGGGTPVVDVWRRDVGLAVGPPRARAQERLPSGLSARLATAPRRSACARPSGGRSRPGERLTTLRTFVAVHRGDHFQTLVAYRRLMLRQGIRLPTSPPSAFEPIWCAWGYGRELHDGAGPGDAAARREARLRLGRRSTTAGRWPKATGPRRRRSFRAGDADMKALVDRIHAAGLQAQLWWSPLAADPGSRTRARAPGAGSCATRTAPPGRSPGGTRATSARRSRRCATTPRAFVRKALGEWGFDGLKIDGQHLNGAPPCFDPAHGHASPEDASEGVPGFFRAIWEEAIATRPDAVVEICPCGTAYSFFTLPYLNMTVASDPESSWQVRLKGKTLKALHGDGDRLLRRPRRAERRAARTSPRPSASAASWAPTSRGRARRARRTRSSC